MESGFELGTLVMPWRYMSVHCPLYYWRQCSHPFCSKNIISAIKSYLTEKRKLFYAMEIAHEFIQCDLNENITFL